MSTATTAVELKSKDFKGTSRSGLVSRVAVTSVFSAAFRRSAPSSACSRTKS